MEEAGGLKVSVRSPVGHIGCPQLREHRLGERPQSDTLPVEPSQVGDGFHPPSHRRDRISVIVQLGLAPAMNSSMMYAPSLASDP